VEFSPVPAPGVAPCRATMRPMKPHPAAKAVLTVIALMLTLIACNQNVKPEPEIPFDRMTPAQHLEKAKSIMKSEDPLNLSQEQIQEATRHLSAIPVSAPESAGAIAFEKQSIEAAKQKYLEKVRQKYTNDLQALLREQGFDIVVTELGDQLILASDLFKDEANRVQFLATIRKIRDSQSLCDVGFRRVALGGSGVFAGTHIYSLGCRSTPKKGKDVRASTFRAPG